MTAVARTLAGALRRGFTFLELVVVLGAIAAVGALAVPYLRQELEREYAQEVASRFLLMVRAAQARCAKVDTEAGGRCWGADRDSQYSAAGLRGVGLLPNFMMGVPVNPEARDPDVSGYCDANTPANSNARFEFCLVSSDEHELRYQAGVPTEIITELVISIPGALDLGPWIDDGGEAVPGMRRLEVTVVSPIAGEHATTSHGRALKLGNDTMTGTLDMAGLPMIGVGTIEGHTPDGIDPTACAFFEMGLDTLNPERWLTGKDCRGVVIDGPVRFGENTAELRLGMEGYVLRKDPDAPPPANADDKTDLKDPNFDKKWAGQRRGQIHKGTLIGELRVGNRVTTQYYMTLSDERYKDDVRDIEARKARLLDRLRTVRYRDRTTGAPRFGFVAQDVRRHFPELVRGAQGDGGAVGGVAYDAMVPLLIRRWRNQQEQLQQLRSKLERLRRARG